MADGRNPRANTLRDARAVENSGALRRSGYHSNGLTRDGGFDMRRRGQGRGLQLYFRTPLQTREHLSALAWHANVPMREVLGQLAIEALRRGYVLDEPTLAAWRRSTLVERVLAFKVEEF